MTSALILDSYGGPRVPYGALGDVVATAPGGGTVAILNAALLRDPVASKVATVTFNGLPYIASGANLGYYGPLRLSVTGEGRLFSGNAWALVNTTLPARTRVEQAWGTTPGTPAYVGGPFLTPVPGLQRTLAFSAPAATFQPFAGYLGGVTGTTAFTLQIDLYLPFARGEFTVGRLFIGGIVQLGPMLLSERDFGAVDYAPQSNTAAGYTARRARGVARTRALVLEPTAPNPTVSTDAATTIALPVLLDLIGANSHLVLAPGAVGATPRGDGPECLYGLLRGPVDVQARAADRQSARLQFIETF